MGCGRKEQESCLSVAVNWLIDRLGMREFTETVVYRHTLHPLYSLGGLTTLMFIIQAVTGLLLLMFYVPIFGQTNMAYDSIVRIMEEVAYGQIVRGLHFYGANLMVFLAILHFLRVYFMGTYKKPRELVYVIGILAGLLTIVAGVTGYSLRMDHIAAEAIRIGSTLVSKMPGGDLLYTLVYGTGTFDEIVGRYLAFHIIVAAILFLLMLVHFFSIHQHHVAPPYDGSEPEPAMPFFPNHLLTEVAAAFVVIGALVMISAAFPAELGEKFIEGKELPVGLPEWYLMAVYTGIKTGIDPVVAGMVIPGILLMVFILMPWMDRSISMHPRNRPIATFYGAVMVGIFLAFTAYGYMTPGQQIPLINGVAITLAVVFVAGTWARWYTSKPKPPKRGRRSKRVPHRPMVLKWGPYLFFLLILVQLWALWVGISHHIQGMYNQAAFYLGLSVMAFGWAFFTGKVLLLDVKYISKVAPDR